MPSRSTVLAALAAAPILTCAQLPLSGQTYTIDAHVIAAGSAVRAGGGCLRLHAATIAEPVAGYSTSAHYTLSAGFRATPKVLETDDLFSSGFESCSP